MNPILLKPHIHEHSFIYYTDEELEKCTACRQDRLGWQPNMSKEELEKLSREAEEVARQVLKGSKAEKEFELDCGNVPFLHCEDGCDCGDCRNCER